MMVLTLQMTANILPITLILGIFTFILGKKKKNTPIKTIGLTLLIISGLLIIYTLIIILLFNQGIILK